MMWILGVVMAVAALGYVAYKYPAWFGAAVNTGAATVNSIDDQIKTAVNKQTANTK